MRPHNTNAIAHQPRQRQMSPSFKPATLVLALVGMMALPGCHHVAANEGATASLSTAKKQPNILYIMADDLGYSDIHAFGGEINTPNLDALVASGRILTDHHTGTVCAITRAMLISGTDHHLVGEGTMGAPRDERKGLPGYEGYLNDSALSFAELLQDAGYHTYMAGKWHIGFNTVGVTNNGGGKTPDQWGWEHSFALLDGAAGNHFGHEGPGSRHYTLDGQYVQPGQPNQPGGLSNPDGSPISYYSTNFFTKKLIEFIDSRHGDGKPFFAYAAYTTPHWQLQVPDPWLHQYKGVYDAGYEAIRDARMARQKKLGLIPQDFTPWRGEPETLTQSPATANYKTNNAKYISAIHSADDGYVDYGSGLVNKRWESLSPLEKKAQARYMEVYAGMVSNLDYNIGLLIQHLKDIGEYDNTFIMFQSDNGAEGSAIARGADQKAIDEANAVEPAYSALGTDNGKLQANALAYGLRWAEVSATPFSQRKSYAGEGGVSTPLIVHLPGQTKQLPTVDMFTHVTDNTATFLALAGVTPPSQPAPDSDNRPGMQPKVLYKGRSVYPITGVSLLPVLQGGSGPVHTAPFGDEAYGRGYLFSADGKWKARWTEPPSGPVNGHWELFDLTKDRGENNDVSAQYPDVVKQLINQWQTYMTRVGGVEPINPRGY